LLRDAAISLSLANLCFVKVWSRVLSSAGSYFNEFPIVYASLIVDVVLLAACFWIGITLVRRSRFVFLARLSRWSLLLAMLTAANAIVTLLLTFLPRSPISLMGRSWANAAGIGVTLTTIFLVFIWRARILKFAPRVILALFPFVLLTFAQGVWRLLGGGVRRQFWPIPAAGVVLMWTALVMTSSRGAIFTALGQIGFGAIILVATRSGQQPAGGAPDILASLRSQGRSVIGRLPAIVFIIGVVAISAVWLGGDLLTTRIKSLSGEVSAPNGELHAGVQRQEVWRSTVALIKAHPIVGNGLGAYSVAITPFHDGSGKWTPEAAHNDYLELAASGGLIAVALVLWFVIALARRAKEQLRVRDPFARAACLGAVTGLFGVAAHSVVDFGLHVTINTVVFIMLVVIATREFQSAASGGSGEAPRVLPVKV